MEIMLFCFDILLFSHYMNFLISSQLYVFSYNIVALNIISPQSMVWGIVKFM